MRPPLQLEVLFAARIVNSLVSAILADALLAAAPFTVNAEVQQPAPLIVLDTDRLPLDEIGLYAAGYQHRSKLEK